MLTQSDSIQVKRSIGRGRGVFARKPIKKGDVIEVAPVLVIPADIAKEGLSNTWLTKFCYEWEGKKLAFSLGYGSLYNHSFKPNAIYEHGRESITFRALRNIRAGEEICINYNWDPEGKEAVSFKVV